MDPDKRDKRLGERPNRLYDEKEQRDWLVENIGAVEDRLNDLGVIETAKLLSNCGINKPLIDEFLNGILEAQRDA